MKHILLLWGFLICFSNDLTAQRLELEWVEYEPIENSGNIGKILIDSNFMYLSGSTYGRDTIDFDYTSNSYQHIVNGISDAFWGKYRKSDCGLEEVFVIAGNGLEQITDMHIDEEGNYYIICVYDSSNTDIAPLNSQSYLISSNGETDIAFVKYNPFGQLIWARHIGGISSDRADGLLLDQNGYLYFGGAISGAVSFDSSDNQIISYNVGFGTPFFAKFDTSGSLQWVKTFPTTIGNCIPTGILDQGKVVLTGSFSDSIYIENQWFYEGGGILTTFLAVFDTSGTYLWADTVGTLISARYVDIEEQSIYLETEIDNDSKIKSLIKYDILGNKIFTKILESSTIVDITSMYSLDSALYVFGYFAENLLFDSVLQNTNEFQTSHRNCIDMFIAKCSKDGDWQWVERTLTTDSILGGPRPYPVTWDENNIYLGIYNLYNANGNADIDFSPNTYSLSRSNAIAKYNFSTTGANLIQFENISYLELYPNPTQNMLMLQSGQPISHVIIYDLAGRPIQEEKWYGVPISLSGLASGVYIVVCYNQEGQICGSEKLIKTN